MEEMIEQAKNEIAVLTENVLYSRIRAFDEDSRVDDETRTKMKDETIEAFVEYCAEKYKSLTPEQIREQVMFRLNKTIENIKRLKEEEGR